MNEQTPEDKHPSKDEHTAKGEHMAKGAPAIKPTHDEVEQGAYALSQKDGRPKGSAEENWLEAEAQLRHAGSGHPELSENQGREGHAGHHAHMAADFRKRIYIALVLTLPVLLLSPMLQTLVGAREAFGFSADTYVLFGFSSALVWYGGGPFLKGLVSELKSLQPGMMTLVAVAIGTPYLYSSAVVFGLSGKAFLLRAGRPGRHHAAGALDRDEVGDGRLEGPGGAGAGRCGHCHWRRFRRGGGNRRRYSGATQIRSMSWPSCSYPAPPIGR